MTSKVDISESSKKIINYSSVINDMRSNIKEKVKGRNISHVYLRSNPSLDKTVFKTNHYVTTEKINLDKPIERKKIISDNDTNHSEWSNSANKSYILKPTNYLQRNESMGNNSQFSILDKSS
jgi:hypothetical protein